MILQILSLGLLGALVALGLWVLIQLQQKYGQLLVRLEGVEARLKQGQGGGCQGQGGCGGTAPSGPAGLAVGSPAPAFEMPDLSGQLRTLEHWHGQNVLLIHFSVRCGFCVNMADRLAALAGDGSDGKPLVVLVVGGDAEENRHFMEEHKVRCPVLLQKDGEFGGAYQAAGTPMGYLVDGDGVIASPLTVGADALLALADKHTSQTGNDPPAIAPSAAGVPERTAT